MVPILVRSRRQSLTLQNHDKPILYEVIFKAVVKIFDNYCYSVLHKDLGNKDSKYIVITYFIHDAIDNIFIGIAVLLLIYISSYTREALKNAFPWMKTLSRIRRKRMSVMNTVTNA